MSAPTRPFLVIYIVWHPGFAAGASIAEALREHFRRKLYENVAGGTGLSVMFRFASLPGSDVPLPINLDESETSAIVVLTESALVKDDAWVAYIRHLVEATEAASLTSRVFPVFLDKEALSLGVAEQALRWDSWEGTPLERQQRLISELSYEFCRMLRHYLANPVTRDVDDEAQLLAYLKNVQIFLSHSKHDEHGVSIAKAIRARLADGHGLTSFFDVHNIPAGVRFDRVLLLNVKTSAVVVIHTDSYSSREWCRREMIEAKRWNVPLVVANCINDMDERSFPYMGNVPVIRMNPDKPDRIDLIVGCLLSELLKDYLWQCRLVVAGIKNDPAITCLPRSPELISLAWLPTADKVASPIIVYPDPPLSAEEQYLIKEVVPRVRLSSITEWIAGAK